MAHIPIHNETDYPLTDAMTQYILRDTQEHFGEEVHAIRVQVGLERHAFNARTHEVRYAFSPQDFGFGPTMSITPGPLTPEPPRARRRSARRVEEPEGDILPASWEDVAMDAEDTAPLATSLDSPDAGRDEEDAGEDVFTLDDQNEDEDDESEDDVEDEDDDSLFNPDEHGA